MAFLTKKYLSRYSCSNGSLKIRNYQKYLQRVFEVSHVSLTKSEVTVKCNVLGVLCICVACVCVFSYTIQPNSGSKCLCLKRVALMLHWWKCPANDKGQCHFPPCLNQGRQQRYCAHRVTQYGWLLSSLTLLLYYYSVLVIFCFQTSLKAARPETILFYINNADIQAVANCVPSMQIATDQRSQLNSSENRLRNDSEKSSVYTNRRKGKNAAQTSPFFYSQQNDQQQV